MKELYKKESVWMSYILRHGAKKEGVEITHDGWVLIEDLIAKAAEQGYKLNTDIIREIVRTDSKQRYAVSSAPAFGKFIRANQGHSLEVDVQLERKIPPVVLYHGTSMKVLDEIKKHGIQKMSRQHVHLSEEFQTAADVGRRHGHPVVLAINCKAMVADGIEFFKSANGVWLTDFVDPKYM